MDFLTNEVIYQKSPQELTALLYERMLEKLEQALTYIDERNYIEVNQQLQRVNDILHRLGVGLKYEAGPIAEQLDTLYNYLAVEVFQANVKKDRSKIENVLTIVESLSMAWTESLKAKNLQASSLTRKVSAYENQIMRTSK